MSVSHYPAIENHSVGITLREHVLRGMQAAPGATGEFTSLVNHLSLAMRIINSRVRSAGLHGLLGYTGETNVQGEAVQKLDAYANDVMISVLSKSGHCSVLASEELDEALVLNDTSRYVVLFDPLDGSSNIDVNVNIGTIFAIYRRSSDQDPLADALQPGHRIAAAGYVVFGPATTFVFSSGQGVHGFTLDPQIGEFFLSHPDIRCPRRGNTYSVNEGNFSRWSEPVQRWNSWMKSESAGHSPYNHRYVGSLVADAHRTLMKGGVFAYPADTRSPKGKLRLLYEANPLAYLFEQAGGAATDGDEPILELLPTELHQRTPLVLGSRDDVSAYGEFMRGVR